jgi:hypothetical protein
MGRGMSEISPGDVGNVVELSSGGNNPLQLFLRHLRFVLEAPDHQPLHLLKTGQVDQRLEVPVDGLGKGFLIIARGKLC